MRPRKGRERRECQIRINVSQEELDRIEALERLVEADSKAAAIRDALKLFEFIEVQSERAGWSFQEQSPAGEVRSLVLPEAPASSRRDPKIPFKILATEAAIERIDELQALVHAETRAELIRRALSAYEYIANQQGEGWSFRAVTETGEQKDLVFLYLPTPPPPRALSTEVAASGGK